MELLQTLVSFAVALGSLIVIHELGHYLVARAAGVKVLRFSVGFGRPLATRRMGPDGTEWVLAAFPLGGYVKMLDEREGPVPDEEKHRAFNRQSVYRRFAIVAAGPVANFLLAIAVYWLLFMHGMPGLRPVVGAPPPGTPAAVAGVHEGQTLVSIGSEQVSNWQDARWALLQHAIDRARVPITLREPDGSLVHRTLDMSGITAEDLDTDVMRTVGMVRHNPPIPAVIGRVIEGGAAERAGMREGDTVVAIDGRPVGDWQQLVDAVRASPGGSLSLDLRRDGTPPVRVSVVPERVNEGSLAVGRIGAAPRIDPARMEALVVEVSYPPIESLRRALARTWDTAIFSLQMLGKMLTGQVSLKNLSGPITIADYAGQSAQVGWVSYLTFIALISISLGVLNLLPVPLLDGGHLMYYIVEFFKGSPVSDRAMQVGQQVGMAVLLTLMLLALYNDLNRLIGS